MSQPLQLSVPEAVTFERTPVVKAAEDALAELARVYPAEPQHVLGLEAWIVFELLPVASDWRLQHLLRQNFVRPAPEPVLHSYWSLLGQGLDRSTAPELVTCLLGAPARVRSGPIFSGAAEDGRSVVYPPARAPHLPLVATIEARGHQSPFTEACLRMAEIFIGHPFQDGNGRFARAAFYGPLIAGYGFRAPCVPIAPLAKVVAPAWVQALRHLGSKGEIGAFTDLLAETVSRTCELTLLRARRLKEA